MNKTPLSESPDFDDQMLSEYQFDYSKVKPNRYSQQQSINAIGLWPRCAMKRSFR
ncbi:MAG: hypothetical protein F6K56_25920 [Moorea sp. SIO3G5]|nr:hypothetical protein [Moorena sp. SIO3G5]